MSLVCSEQRAVVGCVGWLRGRAVTAHATRRGRLSYELSCIAVCVRRCDCDMCALACRTIGVRRDTEEIPRRGGGDGRRGASMGASRLQSCGARGTIRSTLVPRAPHAPGTGPSHARFTA